MINLHCKFLSNLQQEIYKRTERLKVLELEQDRRKPADERLYSNKCKCTGKAGEQVQSNGCTIHDPSVLVEECEDCFFKEKDKQCKQYIPLRDFVGANGQDWPRCKNCLHAAECHN